MLKKSLLTLLLLFVWCNFGYAGYPYDGVCPNPAGGRYLQEDIDQWNFYKCECTSYAAYRLNAISPIGFDNGYQGVGWHDGGHWGYAADQAGIARNKNPLPGDIAWWDSGGSGHVAFVEKVNYDGEGKATSVDITEYNVPIYSYDYNSRTIPVNDPDDYIHFLSHEYDGVACAPHSNGKELCWSYNSNISCSFGEGHFYNDRDSGICYMASASDCSGTIGSSKYVGGRGGGVIGILKGPGYETIPTDSPDPGLPDFIVKKVELSNYNPKKTDEIKMRAQLKNIGDDDISGDDDIETRYYLSKGYKEDSHSEWIRVGKDNTKGRNLDPGETHWEEEGLKLWDYSVIEPGKTYNIVVCVDRTKDKDNGDGDYPEIHKSNNCSTEAVFTVQSTTPPSLTGKFVWSSAGTVSGYQCTQILEPSDPHTWNDNYFCSDNNYGIAWSYNGTISNMRCTLVRESADGSYWDDNYICVPTASDIYFSWSSAGPITSKACVKWSEPADPDTWDDNYLCYEIKTATSPPPPPTYNLQVSSIGFSIQDRPKLWPGESFDVSATAYNAGDNLSSSVSIGYYLDDTLITSHSISASSLTNGIYFSDSLNGITAPSEPGNHSAKVCIDYDNQFQETDETDNCQSISVEVEEHLSPSPMFNGHFGTSANLEDYLTIIHDHRLRPKSDYHAFHKNRVRELDNKSVEDIFNDTEEYSVICGENPREHFFASAQAREISISSANEVIKYILDNISRYSMLDGFNSIYEGLRRDLIYRLIWILELRGWADEDGRSYGNTDENVAVIAERIFKSDPVIGKPIADKLLDASHNPILTLIDFTNFIYASTSSDSTFNLRRSIANYNTAEKVDIRELLSHKAFSFFKEQFINKGKNFLKEIKNIPDNVLLGDFSEFISNKFKKEDKSIEDEINKIKTNIISSLIYRFGSEELGSFAGYVYIINNPDVKIYNIMRNYLFDTCFNIDLDINNSQLFIDYVLSAFSHDIARHTREWRPSVVSLSKTLGEDTLKNYWRDNHEKIKEYCRKLPKDTKVFTSNYWVSYEDDLEDTFKELDKKLLNA